MSTLHQYRWSDLNHCQQNLHCVKRDDSLVIYGEFTTQDQHNMLQEAGFLAARCYWLSNEKSSIAEAQIINHQKWLTLITEHDKTHTWK